MATEKSKGRVVTLREVVDVLYRAGLISKWVKNALMLQEAI